ncbi:MAG: hypothetical protein ACLRXB_09900 [Escherichia coli]
MSLLLRFTLHGIAYHFCHIKSSRNYSVYILLIAPGSIAVLIMHRFHKALLIAVTISITISGVWLLYFQQSPSADNRPLICCSISFRADNNQFSETIISTVE